VAHRLAKVVEATRDEHDPVSKPRLRVAEAILDDPYALHSRQNMLHHHTDLADHAIMLPLRFASLHPCLLLDWLEYHDFCRRERLKTGILMQLAIRRKSIRCSLGQGFVVSRTRRSSTQEADFPLAEVADDHVFKRVRFFLPLSCARCTASSEER